MICPKCGHQTYEQLEQCEICGYFFAEEPPAEAQSSAGFHGAIIEDTKFELPPPKSNAIQPEFSDEQALTLEFYSESKPRMTKKRKKFLLIGAICAVVVLSGAAVLSRTVFDKSVEQFTKSVSEQNYTKAQQIYERKIEGNSKKEKKARKFLQDEIDELFEDFYDDAGSSANQIEQLLDLGVLSGFQSSTVANDLATYQNAQSNYETASRLYQAGYYAAALTMIQDISELPQPMEDKMGLLEQACDDLLTEAVVRYALYLENQQYGGVAHAFLNQCKEQFHLSGSEAFNGLYDTTLAEYEKYPEVSNLGVTPLNFSVLDDGTVNSETDTPHSLVNDYITQGDWIYYLSNSTIYRMKKDLSQPANAIVHLQKAGDFVAVDGDYLYFTASTSLYDYDFLPEAFMQYDYTTGEYTSDREDSDFDTTQYYLCRIKKDGTDFAQYHTVADTGYDMIVMKNNVIYNNADINLICSSTDGTQTQTLAERTLLIGKVGEQFLCFSMDIGEVMVWNPETMKPTTQVTLSVDSLLLADSYYNEGKSYYTYDDTLYVFDYETSKEQKLVQSYMLTDFMPIGISGGKLYLGGPENYLLTYSFDTKKIDFEDWLMDEQSSMYTILGDKIYHYAYDEWGNQSLCYGNPDGSGVKSRTLIE